MKGLVTGKDGAAIVGMLLVVVVQRLEVGLYRKVASAELYTAGFDGWLNR